MSLYAFTREALTGRGWHADELLAAALIANDVKICSSLVATASSIAVLASVYFLTAAPLLAGAGMVLSGVILIHTYNAHMVSRNFLHMLTFSSGEVREKLSSAEAMASVLGKNTFLLGNMILSYLTKKQTEESLRAFASGLSEYSRGPVADINLHF